MTRQQMLMMISFIILLHTSSNAQWQFCGVALCDTQHTGTARLPEVAPDRFGGAYVVWRDGRNGVDYDIYAQRIDRSGSVRWQRNGIPLAALPYGQDFPMVCTDGSGGMFAAWEDSRPEVNNRTCVFAQRVDSSGTQMWQANGVKVAEAPGLFIRMAGDNQGGVVMAWIHFLGIGNSDPFVQRLDGFGQRAWGDSGVRLSARPGALGTGEIAIVGDDSGGAIAAWTEGNSTYAQRVDSSGQIRWLTNGVLLSGNASYRRFATAIASDMQGGAFITWTRDPNSGVYLQHVNHNGQVLWADTGLYVSFGGTAGNIVSDGAGGAIVLTGYASGGSVVASVYRFNNAGSSVWPGGSTFTTELGISQTSLASDNAGGAFVALTLSGSRVKAQWIDSSGVVRYDSNGIVICDRSGGTQHPRVAATGVREAIVVWEPGLGGTTVLAAQVSDTGLVLDVEPATLGVPQHAQLSQNYPNPFNPETTIEFSIAKRGRVTLWVTDVLGRIMETLIDEQREAGTYRTQWKANNRSSGAYFYVLQLDGLTLARKMILMH